jgi:hypothetical protein
MPWKNLSVIGERELAAAQKGGKKFAQRTPVLPKVASGGYGDLNSAGCPVRHASSTLVKSFVS